MTKNMKKTIFKGKNILQKEGVMSFVKQVALFLVNSFYLTYETHYIYEKSLDEVVEMDESKFIPKIENYSLKIITTLREIDELIKGGFDFSLYPEIEDEKQRLSRGAILFCVFVEKDFAHRSWIAMSEENQRDIDPVPYAVDYQGGEVSVGYARTSPKYRGVGIYTYAYYQIYQFLKRKGISKVWFSINKDNIAPQKAQAKLGSEIIAEWRNLKLLWWKFWKEKTKDIEG